MTCSAAATTEDHTEVGVAVDDLSTDICTQRRVVGYHVGIVDSTIVDLVAELRASQ